MYLAALLAGVVLGVVAQMLRQIAGPLMDVGAATTPWVTIGFAIAVWATRRRGWLRDASVVGTGAVTAYLLAWLFAYHSTFAVRESVGPAAAWREALPWLLAAGPGCLVLGVVAGLAHRRGLLGDACLGLPIAWSLPEVLRSAGEASLDGGAVAVVLLAPAVLPFLAAGRSVRPARIAVASLVLGGVALVVAPLLLSHVPS